MAARVPQNVDATHYGDWLKVEWDDNTGLTGDAPEGFEVWYGDTSVTVPVWADAVDTELTGGDGASPVQHYIVMFYTPDDVACTWETFEEYNTGTVVLLGLGGNSWDGPAVITEL
jgi:hypothetical protein